jgi:hypothetical protein
MQLSVLEEPLERPNLLGATLFVDALEQGTVEINLQTATAIAPGAFV